MEKTLLEEKGEEMEKDASHAANHVKEYWHKAKDKCASFMDDIKKDPKLSGAVNLARAHRKETFFVVLMGSGILISFFHFLGGLVVGGVAALCLPWDISDIWKRISDFYDEKGQFMSLVIGFLGLFLLLHVPSLLIGAFFGTALNLFLKNEKTAAGAKILQEAAIETKEEFEKMGKEGAATLQTAGKSVKDAIKETKEELAKMGKEAKAPLPPAIENSKKDEIKF